VSRSDHYLIRVRGHLGPEWSDWLGGLAIANRPDGSADLRGELPDQAALYGVLLTIRDLGLPLVVVCRPPTTPPDSPEGPSCDSSD
jgi:hypothetical protein